MAVFISTAYRGGTDGTHSILDLPTPLLGWAKNVGETIGFEKDFSGVLLLLEASLNAFLFPERLDNGPDCLFDIVRQVRPKCYQYS